jgi:hypothetical protein
MDGPVKAVAAHGFARRDVDLPLRESRLEARSTGGTAPR